MSKRDKRRAAREAAPQTARAAEPDGDDGDLVEVAPILVDGEPMRCWLPPGVSVDMDAGGGA